MLAFWYTLGQTNHGRAQEAADGERNGILLSDRTVALPRRNADVDVWAGKKLCCVENAYCSWALVGGVVSHVLGFMGIGSWYVVDKRLGRFASSEMGARGRNQ